MRAAALDEGDVGQAALAEPVAELSGKLKARRSAADDNDSMRMLVVGRHSHDSRSPALCERPEGETDRVPSPPASWRHR